MGSSIAILLITGGCTKFAGGGLGAGLASVACSLVAVADLVPPLREELATPPQLRSLHPGSLKLQRLQPQPRPLQSLHPRRSQSASLNDSKIPIASLNYHTKIDHSTIDVDAYCCLGSRSCDPDENNSKTRGQASANKATIGNA